VKRPTGGRAVFHADEITYSLITGERNDFFGPVLADYLRIGMGLKKGFELLGLPVQMSEKNRQQKVSHSQICFASQSWYEITCHGRKLVGSAQLRRERSLLQHGSILVTFDAKLLLELTEEGERPKSPLLADRLQQRVIGLKEALGYYPDKFRVISVLLKGLEEKLGIEWKEMPLTPDEVKLAKRLECEKYSRSSSLV
jgi:lipoate-protein ligase A